MDDAGRSAAEARHQREIGGEQAEAVGIGGRSEVCGENEVKGVHEGAS